MLWIKRTVVKVVTMVTLRGCSSVSPDTPHVTLRSLGHVLIRVSPLGAASKITGVNLMLMGLIPKLGVFLGWAGFVLVLVTPSCLY